MLNETFCVIFKHRDHENWKMKRQIRILILVLDCKSSFRKGIFPAINISFFLLMDKQTFSINVQPNFRPTNWTTLWFPRLFSPSFKKFSNFRKKWLLRLQSVWKSPKKSHSTLQTKRAWFTFWVDKSSLKMPKMVKLTSFWKPEACGQTVLPDRSILIGQKLVENARIEKFKCDILGNF